MRSSSETRCLYLLTLSASRDGFPGMADALRASLRLSGQESETWILTRVGDKAKGAVLVVEPITGVSSAHSPT